MLLKGAPSSLTFCAVYLRAQETGCEMGRVGGVSLGGWVFHDVLVCSSNGTPGEI